MGHHRSDAGRGEVGLESLNLPIAKGLGVPLPVALGEHLDGIASNLLTPQRCLVEPPRDGHVCAEADTAGTAGSVMGSLGDADSRHVLQRLAEEDGAIVAKAFGQQTVESREVDQVERQLFPWKEPQRHAARGGHHLLGLSERHVGLADHAERQTHRDAKLAHPPVLFLQFFGSGHPRPPETSAL